MCNPVRMDTYREIWTQVQQTYNVGFVVSERGLQAVLHGELQARLHDVQVVVEPTWVKPNGITYRPDLVLVEGGKITDIFELKFVPHGYAKWKKDIEAVSKTCPMS